MNEETASAENREPEVGDDNEALPVRPEIRAAFEPTCCGSGCVDCPF
jgi:hypothetical protein